MSGMVAAGRVGGLFGNRGELTLVLYAAFPPDPNNEEPVFVEFDGHRVPLFFEKFAKRGVRGATAVFADIDNAGRAGELVGREFFIRAPHTPAGLSDELYFEDLVGWEAEVGEGNDVDDGRERLRGRITAFFDSEMNPLFEVELGSWSGDFGSRSGEIRGGGTELIPAQEDFIVEIDEENRRVVFELPEGLLGLND